jgi:hypothetical protein
VNKKGKKEKNDKNDESSEISQQSEVESKVNDDVMFIKENKVS